ncbi:basic proline-rich protein-like [Bacillus rossius redtenbacheri]|uniref:basic proline-rich protein-like n=1 Tax=Bacillus rossius redtenbacheri TaxID=93214 RepID=UPI002FDEA1E6
MPLQGQPPYSFPFCLGVPEVYNDIHRLSLHYAHHHKGQWYEYECTLCVPKVRLRTLRGARTHFKTVQPGTRPLPLPPPRHVSPPLSPGGVPHQQTDALMPPGEPWASQERHAAAAPGATTLADAPPPSRCAALPAPPGSVPALGGSPMAGPRGRACAPWKRGWAATSA